MEVFTVPTLPGPYRLRIDRPDERAEFALVVLKEPAVVGPRAGGRWPDVGHPVLASDPKRRGDSDAEAFFKIARLELALQGASSRTAPALLAELTAAGIAEPMVLLVQAYITCVGGNPKLLREQAGRRLMETYPDLPDGHVSLGRLAEADGRNDEARKAYRNALDRGLPILARALKELHVGVKHQNRQASAPPATPRGCNEPDGPPLERLAANRTPLSQGRSPLKRRGAGVAVPPAAPAGRPPLP